MIFAYICKVGLFGSLCAGMFLTSCMERENEEASKRVIEVGKAISSPAELKASDYFDEIRYVPLETRDDCLVGSSPDIMRISLRDCANRTFLRLVLIRGASPFSRI